MKIRLLKILTVVILLSVSYDALRSFWSKYDVAIEMVDTGETENPKEGKKEKEEKEDKISCCLAYPINSNVTLDHSQRIAVSEASACLSLPDIPPEQA